MSSPAPRDSYVLRHRFEDEPHRLGKSPPVRRLFLEPSPSGGGEAVILCFALVLRLAPLGSNQGLLFEAIQRGIERALLDQQPLARNLLDAQQDAVSVQRPERDRLEDEEVERSLQ